MALLSPLPVFQFFNDDGSPLVGGLLFSYEAGTSTPTPTFTDSSGNVQNANPIELDTRGQAIVWLNGLVTYKLVLARPGDGDFETPPTDPIWSVDNITAGGQIYSGMMLVWAHGIDTIPAGWFLCDGTNGTRDMRNFFVVGAGDAYAPGDTGGSPTQTTTIGDTTLTIDQIPAHAHAITDPGHSHGITDPGHVHAVTDPGHVHAITDPQHTHTVNDPTHNHGITDPGHQHQLDTLSPFVLGGPNGLTTLAGSPGNFTDTAVTNVTINDAATGITNAAASTGISVNSHTTGLTVNSAVTGIATNTNTTGITTQDTGGDGSHTHTATNTTNLPPYIALCWIAKG